MTYLKKKSTNNSPPGVFTSGFPTRFMFKKIISLGVLIVLLYIIYIIIFSIYTMSNNQIQIRNINNVRGHKLHGPDIRIMNGQLTERGLSKRKFSIKNENIFNIKPEIEKDDFLHLEENFKNLYHYHFNYSDIKSTDNKSLKNEEINEERKEFLDRFSLKMENIKKSPLYHQKVSLLPKQTKGVILLSNYRSGSTFLGELFNQHSKAFYIFEPLLPFSGHCIYYKDLKIEMLSRTLKCDFPSMIDVFRKVEAPLLGTKVKLQCLDDDFCFRYKTQELCRRSLCLYPTKFCKKCGPLPLPQAMNLCREKELSVVKVIRFCDILDLKSIVLDPTLNVKIIHLIRDPRGIQSSRIKIKGNWSMVDDAQKTCERLLHNAEQATNKLEENQWLANRYFKVRYEDLSMDPITVAKEIYQFVGLDFNPFIEHWIEHNTNFSPTFRRLHPYSTKRNSTVTMQAWRDHLTFEQVQKIQNVCSKMMHYFGYRLISTPDELRNKDYFLF